MSPRTFSSPLATTLLLCLAALHALPPVSAAGLGPNLLQNADFAHALPISVTPRGGLSAWTVDLGLTVYRDVLLREQISMPLTCCAHTLAFYRRLPHGWRTTPAGSPTDRYMCQQMLALADCRVVSGRRPTVLTFPSPTAGVGRSSRAWRRSTNWLLA